MKREQLTETINQTALNVWRDNGMILQVREESRGRWTIKLNHVEQKSVRTGHVFCVMNAMIATARNYKPLTLKLDTIEKAGQASMYEVMLYVRAGERCPEDTPTQQAYERMKKQRETAKERRTPQ